MEKNTILAIALLLPYFLFCQRPFVPMGAQWGAVSECSPTFWPCPTYYPVFYTYEVTEDTIIQGKYCTMIEERDWTWVGGFVNSIVHQDSHRIFRYDRIDEEFKLVLDFSKNVGESWLVEVPEYWAGNDTFTFTVLEKDEDFRRVRLSVDGVEYWDFPLYEGFGGIAHNKRLLVGDEFFITADPIIWDELTCYIDPTEGLIYGHAFRCNPTSTSNLALNITEYTVNPNPASSHIILDSKHPLVKSAEWSMSNALGQVVKSQPMATGTKTHTLMVEDLTSGFYFWKVQIEGRIVETGKIMISKE